MELKIKRLHENATIPVRAHKGDAGLDLTSVAITTEVNEAGEVMLVYHTGIAVEIPEGYFGLIVPRSSICKKSLMLSNHAGIIDAGFVGEITAKFRTTVPTVPAVYKVGERFCQLVIIPIPQIDVVEAEELSETERGENGYGSTGNSSAPSEALGSSEEKTEVTNQENMEAAGDVKAPEQAQ